MHHATGNCGQWGTRNELSTEHSEVLHIQEAMKLARHIGLRFMPSSRETIDRHPPQLPTHIEKSLKRGGEAVRPGARASESSPRGKAVLGSSHQLPHVS